MLPSRLVIFTLILLFGVVARSLHIDDQSIWVDEGYAIYHANYPSLIETLSRDTHPPLYFASLRLWQELVGNSTFALRWFSLLPSILSLAMIVPLACELVRLRGKRAGSSVVPILVMFLLALADAEIFLAQELRHYTWQVLLVISSMWAYLRWIRTRKSPHGWLWVALTTALVYTHYISVFIPLVQGIYALLFLREKVRWQAISGLGLVAGFLLPLAAARRHTANRQQRRKLVSLYL